MLAWCNATVATPFGNVAVVHWAVPDDGAADALDDLPHLDDAQDQLGAVMWNSNGLVAQHLHDHLTSTYAAASASASAAAAGTKTLATDTTIKRPHGEGSGLHVLELGAGVGVLGIALAMAGHTVAVTDIKELLPLMQHNIALNAPPPRRDTTGSTKSGGGGGGCHAFAWKWGEPTPSGFAALMRGRLDAVVLCDALYGNPKDWPKLVATLTGLAAAYPGVRVVNFCEQRVENVEDGFIQLITTPLAATEGRPAAGKGQQPQLQWVASPTASIGASELQMTVRVTVFARQAVASTPAASAAEASRDGAAATAVAADSSSAIGNGRSANDRRRRENATDPAETERATKKQRQESSSHHQQQAISKKASKHK